MDNMFFNPFPPLLIPNQKMNKQNKQKKTGFVSSELDCMRPLL